MSCFQGDLFVAFFKGSQQLRYCHWGLLVINTSLHDTTLIRAIGSYESGWTIGMRPYDIYKDASLVRLVHIGRMSGHYDWIDSLKARVRVTNGDRQFDSVVWVERAIDYLCRHRKLVIINNDVNAAMKELTQLAHTAASRNTFDFQTVNHCIVPEYGGYN